MNDARLQSLYRRLSAAPNPASADELTQALSRAGYPDEEGTVLDRIANSTAHADLLRTAMQLAPDAAALSRDVAALRAPQRAHAPARGWLALAAGVGAAAILIATLRDAPQPVAELSSSPVIQSDSILSASFEAEPAPSSELSEAEPIFRGDFDS